MRISYPPETSSDFVDKFKTVVNEFDSLLPPPAQPIATNTDVSINTSPVASIVAVPTVASVPAPPVKPVVAPRKLFFWKAKKGSDVVYLLGTIHTAPPSLYPLPREIESAFNDSKCLIVEVDISKRKVDPAKVHQLVESFGKYLPPDKLSKHLSPSTKRVFDAYLSWAGESWAMYDQYKPWYARELITASIPRRGDLSKLRKGLGIDLHFLEKLWHAKNRSQSLRLLNFS